MRTMSSSEHSLAILALCVTLAPAIDNGIGLTPPRGWRSWNAFDCTSDDRIITQEHMRAQMDAVTDKSRLVNGKPTSLAELGFDYISMDDGWQECNCSVYQDLDPSKPECPGRCYNGQCTWHDAGGHPMVRKDRFHDMKALVDYGHSMKLKVGTYLNNCICMERGPTHYEQDVQWLMDMGFDGVKIDNCGTSTDVKHFADLFNATGKAIRIENCHNSWPDFGTGFCPMNFFRTGGDINANMGDIIQEAYGTVGASDRPHPRSHPGCWGYPDMSEIGNFPPSDTRHDEEMSHWGLWCIVSSPLVLGFDMNNSGTMDRVWPIITNTDALSVSETWAGHPGTLIKVYPAVGQGYQVVQGDCDGSSETVGWQFRNGSLVAPNREGEFEAQCVTIQDTSCPPPTTRNPNLQCGLAIGNCSHQANGQWTMSNHAVRWNSAKCLSASPSNFDVNKGYFTRSAGRVKMDDCPKTEHGIARAALSNATCASLSPNTNVDGPEVIKPKDPSKVCGVDLAACCAACDQNDKCKAFVWKSSESSGIGCDSGKSYCWLLSNFSGIRSATDGTFGSKALVPPVSPTYFAISDKGELRSADGNCLRTAPTHGVQLWAKPLLDQQVALFLVNPMLENQSFKFPLADIPAFQNMSLVCSPGQCKARDIWKQVTTVIATDHIEVSLRPYASAFLILSKATSAVVV